jgi:ABC-2 type transport system permease protein
MRWQVFWYGLGFALMAMLVVYIYPSYRGQLANFEMPEAFQALLGESADYSSPEGFVSGEIFSWLPVLLVVFAIMQGTNLLGGEEASGTIDVLMAQPITRSRLLLQKMAAFVVGAAGIVVLTGAAWFVSVPFVDIDISYGKLLLATANMLPLAIMFGALSMWLSVALTGRQAASGIATAVAVAAFVLNYLATLVDVLKPIRWVSPFFYANTTNVLTSGADWAKVAVLLGLSIVFVVLALRAFERRDLGVQSAVPLMARLRWRSAAS